MKKYIIFVTFESKMYFLISTENFISSHRTSSLSKTKHVTNGYMHVMVADKGQIAMSLSRLRQCYKTHERGKHI